MKYDFKTIKALRVTFNNNGELRSPGQRSMDIKTLSSKIGVSPVTMWRLENGISIPTADTIGTLSAFFGVGVERFFPDKKEKK